VSTSHGTRFGIEAEKRYSGQAKRWNRKSPCPLNAGIGKPEFKVSVQVDQTGKANGQELHLLEILSYDPIKKIHTSSGFSSDGSPWTLTATFDDARVTEEGVSKGPDGQATTCQTTWSFSSDRKSLSGTQECKQNGVRWTAFVSRERNPRRRIGIEWRVRIL